MYVPDQLDVHYFMCKISKCAEIDIDTMTQLFENSVLPSSLQKGNGGHVNCVYLNSAEYTEVCVSMSNVISDRPAFSCD